MHALQLNYFSQYGRRFKYCCWGILLAFRYNDVIYCISISFINIFLWCHVDISHLSELHHFTSWYHSVLYIFICVIYFGCSQICTNNYFDYNSFSSNGHNFLFPWYSSIRTDGGNKITHDVFQPKTGCWLSFSGM